MSAPQPQVLESVQQLANYFARLLGRGEAPNPEGETYQRLTQGLGPGEVAQAQDYARRAEALRQEMLAAPPGTPFGELPSYGRLGAASPVANVLHVYGTRDPETGQLAPSGDYRSDPYAVGPARSMAWMVEEGEARDVAEWTPPASELDVDYRVDYIVPFNLYA